MTRTVAIDPPGGRKDSPTFEQPFEMMEACHDRVQRMLTLLARLREHLAAHGADEQARQAAQDIMRYFDQAAPQHHRDEELHVFPPLLAQGDPDTVAVVRQLQHDHELMDTRWGAARDVLLRIAGGELEQLDERQAATLEGFAGLYGGHIEAEESIAYPASRSLLGEDAQREMGREMSARRGIR
jgi:hemerythrin-like domain-containing protein